MNARMITAFSLLSTLASLAIAEPSARADASCIAPLQQRTAQTGTYPYFGWTFEMTIHREDVELVTYSSGTLQPNGSGGFFGVSNQLFSDRHVSGNYLQTFDYAQRDNLSLSLSPTGLLHIHYSPWNFDTDWDMSCSGPIVTRRVPGVGVVTLTFRRQVSIIG